MAVTVTDDTENGIVYFDGTHSGSAETLKTVAAGNIVGVDAFVYSNDTAGQMTIAHGRNIIGQFSASGGIAVTTLPKTSWGTDGTDLTLNAPAGEASGFVYYRLRQVPIA